MKTLTIEEVSQLLDVSTRTILRWEEAGKFPKRHQWRPHWLKKDVGEWMKKAKKVKVVKYQFAPEEK